ncbi:MAG: N-acetyl sugar amidotransferase [Lachnospiraceae bacterium]|nr:N-acetyl sugar amidotransferase [Lachnospiraceae bacterium]
MAKTRVCKRCIMDNSSDKSITFDENGFCNYCTKALSEINTTVYFPNEIGKRKLDEIISMIKKENQDKPYDCIMGLSGGLDSSYLAYLGYTWGLRILAVHIDDGYDTEISKANIRKLCEKAHIEMRTVKPDPEQFNALTLAYMRAGVPNLAVPQDNILFAFLYDTVVKEKLKYFLTGGNFALECILQKDHVFNAMDTVNIYDIQKKFGTKPINKLKFISSYKKYMNIRLGKAITLRPLNYIDYNRDRAFKELYDFCGFEYYGSKHLENILTAFVQLYWFPKKFGVDKRTSHLSSMIASGQMTREKALEELKKPPYDEKMMERYIEILKSNLGISDEQFEQIMNEPAHEHEDYRTDKLSVVLRKFIH